MKFLVDNSDLGCHGWYTYQELKNLAELCPEEGYQSDSPEAEFITGYNTDSYADDLCELIVNCWEEYLEECDEAEKQPSWDEGWETHIWDNSDYQLCHTWLRVTNLKTESDEEVKLFAKDCDRATMGDRLGI